MVFYELIEYVSSGIKLAPLGSDLTLRFEVLQWIPIGRAFQRYQRSILYQNRLSSFHSSIVTDIPLMPPPIKRLIGTGHVATTSLPHHSPRTLPHDILHGSLVAYHTRQHLRPSFPRKVPATVRIQPFIHDPLSRPCILDVSQHVCWIIRVGRSRDAGAVVQDIAPCLPAWKQDSILEFVARGDVDAAAREWSWRAFGGAVRVEGGPRGSDEGVEILGDGVVHGRSADSKKVLTSVNRVLMA